MRKKSLLVVGAGFGQVPAIKAAKEIGLRVLTVDIDPIAPGMEMADESFVVDIMDKKSVLQLSIKQKIDGIITLQSDHGVPTVGYVNDHLGLNGISFETAINCSHKTKCRKKLSEKNCSQPDFRFVSNVSEAKKAVNEIGIPCVIKSPDSSGSRGITKVTSVKDIEKGVVEAFKNSSQNKVIVEEFVDGIEFGAQTFSVDGKCEVVLLHNDLLSEPPYMIPIGHSFPFKDLSYEEAEFAKIKIKEAVEAVGITNGPANIDIILENSSKEAKVIEIGARIGATCLPELVYYHTGVNWVEEAIKSALGESNNLSIKDTKPVAAQIIYASKDGIFRGYHSKSDNKIDDILEFEITVGVGEGVSKLTKGTDRIGKVISKGENVFKAENSVERFIDDLKLKID